MGCCRLALSIFAFALIAALSPQPAHANGAVAAAASGAAEAHGAETRGVMLASVLHHRKKARSFYCYPQVYWWFYRPYTTGRDGHPRCMPYFHIQGQEQYFKGAGNGRLK